MLGSFKDPEKEVLRDYYTKYLTEYRTQTNSGKLDKAFQDHDPKLMKNCLDELKPSSRWFLKAAAKRFADLIDEEI